MSASAEEEGVDKQQQWVPEWIRANSDLWSSLVANEKEEDDDHQAAENNNTNDHEAERMIDRVCREQRMPVCGVDCTDGARYYTVLTYWCVSPHAVSLPFCRAWFQLPPGVRTAILLKTGGAHAKELGGTMLLAAARLDDPALLATVPFGEILAAPGPAGPGEMRLISLLLAHDAVRCMRSVVESHGGFSSKCAVMAVKLGALNVLKDNYLVATCTDRAMVQNAIEHGKLPVLQWLCRKGAYWFTSAEFELAAQFGYWSIIEWLRAYPNISTTLQRNVLCMQSAARGGHTEIIKRLREEGCPWPDDDSWGNICCIAAFENRFEALRWAKANGCPWHQASMVCCSVNSSRRIREWIAAGGPTEELKEKEEEMEIAKRKRTG